MASRCQSMAKLLHISAYPDGVGVVDLKHITSSLARLAVRQLWNCTDILPNQFFCEFVLSVHVGQPLIASLIEVRQFLVIQAHKAEQRRVDIVRV